MDHIGPHIIVTGNPIEGFNFIGPFPSVQDAATHGNSDADIPPADWWVAPLEAPEAGAGSAMSDPVALAQRLYTPIGNEPETWDEIVDHLDGYRATYERWLAVARKAMR